MAGLALHEGGGDEPQAHDAPWRSSMAAADRKDLLRVRRHQLRTMSVRVGADLTAAQDRLADLDANVSVWQEIVELAAAFAARCGDAYRKATDRTRKQLSAAVFERLDVRDGRIGDEEHRPPFDDIFNVPEPEYGTRERATGIEPA